MTARTPHSGIVCGHTIRPFAEVEARARRIAGGLAALGVRQGDCVCILMRNDVAFLEASYAVAMLGAYAVPINWHFKAEEVHYILADTATRVLIGHADLLRQVAAAVPAAVTRISVTPPDDLAHTYHVAPSSLAPLPGVADLEAWLAAQAPYDGVSRPAPASMIYTSGTTGHPKGVRRATPTAEQQASAEAMRARIYGLKPGARALLPGPLYHSAPNAFGLRAGRLGGVLVLMPRFEPEAFLRIVQDEAIDTAFMVPTMFVRLMKLPEATRRAYDVSSLSHVIHAAAPCPPDVKRAMIDWWGPVIYEFYGSTESGAVTFATSEDALKKPGTVGRIAPGAELRFLDDDGREVAPGAVGEIFSRIAGNPDFTYHNKPEKRAEIDRDGFITSGDVGFIDADGYVFISDRKRDMVISGGVNIYPAEIEAVLHGLAGVHDCAVFGIPNAEFGETLMAVVEPMPAVTLDIEALRAGLKAALADYKVPRHIEIATALPREDSGKIFKRRLRDPYWEGAKRRI
ncbi:MAG: acyl-CoA synthetase [Xanthobacteraceae bacterium]|nr:acyl-CoA synthetase [Xanthobacteraceae bacterium]